MTYANLFVTSLFYYSSLTCNRQCLDTAVITKVCMTVTCMHAHPIQGLAILRTLDYNKGV